MSYSDYIKVSDAGTIEKIEELLKERRKFHFKLNAKAKEHKFLGAHFEKLSRPYLHLFGSDFIGFIGNTSDRGVYEPEFRVLKGLNYLESVYVPRKSCKDFYRKYSEQMEGIEKSFNMDSILPLIFSKYPDSYGSCPIASAKWGGNIDGCMLFRLAWFGRSREDYELSSLHEVIKESEYLRLQGR